jgi:hypothetical protein
MYTYLGKRYTGAEWFSMPQLKRDRIMLAHDLINHRWGMQFLTNIAQFLGKEGYATQEDVLNWLKQPRHREQARRWIASWWTWVAGPKA